MTNYSGSNNRKRHKNSKSRKRKAKNKARIVVFRIFITLLLITCFAGVGAVFGAYMGIIENVDIIENATFVAPRNYVSIVYDKDGNEIDRFTGLENREYANIEQIPLHLQQAFIAIEDERFFSHNGIDVRGIARSVYQTVFKSNTQGASTITQQLIKLNFMGLSRNTFQTKIQEQYLAVKFESMLEEQLGSKEAAKAYILGQYLNSVPLNHGLYGVQTASRYYFNKEVSELTLSESAVIAAITQRPTFFTPAVNPENNRVRQVHVLDKMLELGFITEEERTQAYYDNVYERVGQHRAYAGTASEANRIRGYFSDQVILDVARDLQNIGFSRQDAFDLIYSGGLSIHTTMDQNIQTILEETFMNNSLFSSKDYRIDVDYFISIKNNITGEVYHKEEKFSVREYEQIAGKIEEIKNKHLTANMSLVLDRYVPTVQPQAAMVVLDYRTGYVRGVVGGRGEKTVNLALNRANSSRQPGSVFKVVAAFAPAIDLGLVTPGSIIMDEPFTYEMPGGSYTPSNHWGSTFRGPQTVRYAVVQSANVMTVKLLVELGIDVAFDYLQQFGFTTLVDGEVRNGRVFTDRGPALALGGITDGVTVLETTAAYGTIANNGVYLKPTFYTQVFDHDGSILLEYIPEEHKREVLKPTTAYMITDMMKDVLTSGTGTRARLSGMPAAGKTGTTQNTRDLTFAGYTDYYAASIWYGFDEGEFLGDTSSYHLDVWKHAMDRIHAGFEPRDFTMPDGLVRLTLCVDSGKRAIPGLCDNDIRGSRVRTDLVPLSMASNELCDIHATITIDTLTGMLASYSTPEHRRFTFTGIVVNDDLATEKHEIPRSMTVVGSTMIHPYYAYGHLEDDNESIEDEQDGPVINTEESLDSYQPPVTTEPPNVSTPSDNTIEPPTIEPDEDEPPIIDGSE